MNSGSFFRLDLETSKVVSGVNFYEYIDLPDLAVGVDGLRYPIRLTISQERVSVFVHYYDDSGEFIPHHTEDIILDLPYLTTNTESLSSTIKRVYNTVFPLSDYLQRLMSRRYDGKREKEWQNKLSLAEKELASIENEEKREQKDKEIKELEKELAILEKYRCLQDSQVNKDSYSSLYIWDLVDKTEGKYNYLLLDGSYNPKSEEKPKITKFLRKLLLDFMFDLMHSDVFESSKFYAQMQQGLMSDFFFSSIVKKSEYYYYRRIIRNNLESVATNKDDLASLRACVRELRKIESLKQRELSKERNPEVIDSINKKYKSKVEDYLQKGGEGINKAYDIIRFIKDLYAEKLDEAEAEWINVISGPLSDKHFSFSPEWYEDQKARKKKKGFNVSESWFVNPEEEMTRIAFPLKEEPEFIKKGEERPVHYLNSFELEGLIGTGDNSSVLERNTNMSKWFYRRFDFVDAFRIHLFKNWNHAFAFFLFAFAITALFQDFWACPRNIALFLTVAAASFFLTSIFFCCTLLFKSNKRIDDILVRNRQKRESMKAFRLSLICGAVGAFLYFYDLPYSTYWQYFVVKVVALVAIILLSLCVIPPRVHIIDNIHLLLPRLVASITAAWVMIVIGNDLVKEHLPWPIWIILSVVVFAFILYEGTKSLPNITPGVRVWRALELMLISFSISLIIGIFAINILSPSLVEDAKAYDKALEPISWSFLNGYDELTISIFPDYLIQFSFLAMFIGVFIQMIFEEKNITEM